MQNLHRAILTRVSSSPSRAPWARIEASRLFSAASDGGGGGGDDWNNLPPPSGFDAAASWSPGNAAGRPAEAANHSDDELVKEFVQEARGVRRFVDGWGTRFQETCDFVKQAREPGARGSYLKDSDKAEMCRLHRRDPAVYSVERLAKDYRVMRQRVLAILWLDELEAQGKRPGGSTIDDCVEKLLDGFPEFFESHDREFHVASLSRKPDFKVMLADWDGTTRDADEVHFEISQKEDEYMYQEFVKKLEFVKKKVAGEVYTHKYSRRRPTEGWKFTVEKMGPRGKRGNGGGWKFVSMPDGSSRPLDELEKMFLKRETPRAPRRILSTYRP